MNREKLIDWGASLGICLGYMGNFIYYPILVSKLGIEYSGFWAGLVIWMTYVGRLSATFCYNYISKKYMMRNVISGFVLLEGIALLAMGFSNTRLAYLILAYWIGFGSGISFPALKHILSTLPEEMRTAAFSRFQLFAQSGMILGALMGSLWPTPQMLTIFTMTFLLFVSYTLIAFIFLPKEKKESIQENIQFFDFSLLKNNYFPEIKYDLFMSIIYWVLIMGFMVIMPLQVQAYIPTISVSTPFWLTGIILLTLQMFLLHQSKKYLGISGTMFMGCLALFVGFLALSIYPNIAWLVTGCIMIALGQIFFAPALDLHVSNQVEKGNMGKAMSAMHFYRSLGNMIGTLIAGILFDWGYSRQLPNLSWIILGILAFILSLSYLVLLRKRLKTEYA